MKQRNNSFSALSVCLTNPIPLHSSAKRKRYQMKDLSNHYIYLTILHATHSHIPDSQLMSILTHTYAFENRRQKTII